MCCKFVRQRTITAFRKISAGGERDASRGSETEEEFQKIKEETIREAAKDMVKKYVAGSLRNMVGNLERVVRGGRIPTSCV